MSAERFPLARRVGIEGEKLVTTFLLSRGFGIIPCYDIAGFDGRKAPRLIFGQGGLLLPDLDVCKIGTRRSWAEIKAYHGPAPNWRHKCLVHGIPHRHFEDYLEVEKLTGNDVFVFVVEYDSGDLLCAQLSLLSAWGCQCPACEQGSPQRCRADIPRGMYWRRDHMKLLHTFSDSELEPLRRSAKTYRDTTATSLSA